MKKLLLFLTISFLSFSTVRAGGVKVGDKVRNISLKNIDGSMYSLSDQKKEKGFVIIFTCNHCPFSVAYEDRIIALQEKYGSLGYPVVAINPNDPDIVPEDSFEQMKIRASEKKFNFPYLYDQSQQVAAYYGATRTPHVFILNKENNEFVVRYIGAIDNNVESAAEATDLYVENALQELLAGKQVSNSQTKAIGCTIKWKK